MCVGILLSDKISTSDDVSIA